MGDETKEISLAGLIESFNQERKDPNLTGCPSPEHFELTLNSIINLNDEEGLNWVDNEAYGKDEDEVNAMTTPFPLMIDSKN